MGIVAGDLKVLESIFENGGWLSLVDQFGQRSWFARDLFAHAVDLIEANRSVTTGPAECFDTRAASSTGQRAKSDFLSIYQ